MSIAEEDLLRKVSNHWEVMKEPDAFLDGLAHHRRALGLPGLSINWGACSEIGAAVNYLTRHKQTGMGSIAPQQGLEVLEHLFCIPWLQAQVGVVPINWSKFLQQFQDRKPSLLSELALAAPVDTHTVSKVIDLANQLKDASPDEGHTLLLPKKKNGPSSRA